MLIQIVPDCAKRIQKICPAKVQSNNMQHEYNGGMYNGRNFTFFQESPANTKKRIGDFFGIQGHI